MFGMNKSYLTTLLTTLMSLNVVLTRVGLGHVSPVHSRNSLICIVRQELVGRRDASPGSTTFPNMVMPDGTEINVREQKNKILGFTPECTRTYR